MKLWSNNNRILGLRPFSNGIPHQVFVTGRRAKALGLEPGSIEARQFDARRVVRAALFSLGIKHSGSVSIGAGTGAIFTKFSSLLPGLSLADIDDPMLNPAFTNDPEAYFFHREIWGVPKFAAIKHIAGLLEKHLTALSGTPQIQITPGLEPLRIAASERRQPVGVHHLNTIRRLAPVLGLGAASFLISLFSTFSAE